MRKDENPADLDVCFSDIWSAAQHSRSYFLRMLFIRTWRRLSRPAAPREFKHVHPISRDAHEEVEA
ncbi:hypothetical protein AS156_09730 [Bradyrhizobium macuxiense]|uniref:Uncharacterized protein n=1 Tax=Bradyrhizobium macuxiense TaxID=1755647 RepID=A0A109JPW6_9BRAD|nr:hypothetical protein AS156_09730 [Bradyrhizobium macuxiense]